MMDRRSMIASGALAAGALLASNAAGATVLPRAAAGASPRPTATS